MNIHMKMLQKKNEPLLLSAQHLQGRSSEFVVMMCQ